MPTYPLRASAYPVVVSVPAHRPLHLGQIHDTGDAILSPAAVTMEGHDRPARGGEARPMEHVHGHHQGRGDLHMEETPYQTVVLALVENRSSGSRRRKGCAHSRSHPQG